MLQNKIFFRRTSALAVVASILFLSAVAIPVFAQGTSGGNLLPTTFGGNTSPSVGGGNSSFQLQNPLNYNSLCGLVQAIFAVLLAIGTPIAVLFLVYAGFRFIWARGNTTELQKARTNLVHVILGIAIFLGAWILGQVIANTINSLATAAGQQSITGNACN